VTPITTYKDTPTKTVDIDGARSAYLAAVLVTVRPSQRTPPVVWTSRCLAA
jgi:hypothetical protein